MNVAVILAGGTGSRFGGGLPKQFFEVAGKMVIEHTIYIFENCSNIDEIAIVVSPNHKAIIEQMIKKNRYKKVKKILNSGQERYMSSLSAIEAYRGVDGRKLILHDAVRPLISHRVINDVVEALQTYNAVGTAIEATDTIIEVDNTKQFIKNIPNRNFLQHAQTPQAFSIEVIAKAYSLAMQDGVFLPTDDCSVVKRYLPQESIFIVKGEKTNIKLTHQEDIPLIEQLFKAKNI